MRKLRRNWSWWRKNEELLPRRWSISSKNSSRKLTLIMQIIQIMLKMSVYWDRWQMSYLVLQWLLKIWFSILVWSKNTSEWKMQNHQLFSMLQSFSAKILLQASILWITFWSVYDKIQFLSTITWFRGGQSDFCFINLKDTWKMLEIRTSIFTQTWCTITHWTLFSKCVSIEESTEMESHTNKSLMTLLAGHSFRI